MTDLPEVPEWASEQYQCSFCARRPVGEKDPYGERCDVCWEADEERRNEVAYERQQSEGFRGTEAAGFLAEEQARIQRELKR